MISWVLFSLLANPTSYAVPLESYLHNREAIKSLEKKSYYNAYQELLNALKFDPLNAELQMNLAFTFEMNEEFEKAAKVYRSLLPRLKADDPRKFEALFNLGNVLSKQKDIDGALGAYQAALDLHPDSVEVKTNIELLFQGGDGGSGDGQQKEDQQNQDDKKNSKNSEPQQENKEKREPKPFESQDLTPQDVRRILDEIKNQEQSIRAQENEKGAKESGRARDW